RHVRERHRSGDVADGPDALSGPAAVIDLDPALAGFQADALESQPGDPRRAADGDDQLVPLEHAPVRQVRRLVAIASADRLDLGPELHIDPVIAQRVEDQLADPLLLA